jgi:GNAT superfamily N-acetyltransferase
MALLSWHRSDHLPADMGTPGVVVRAIDNVSLLGALTELAGEEVQRRLAHAHQPYVAWLDAHPVAYGWVAREQASVGELGQTLRLDARTRYLWDFVTLPAWRGQRIYQRLLHGILEQEGSAEQFWIIHAPENRASGRGIRRAGFLQVGELSFLDDKRPALAQFGSAADRASEGAALLDVQLLSGLCACALAPWWRCQLQLSSDCGCVSGRAVCGETRGTCSAVSEPAPLGVSVARCKRICPCIATA